MRIILLCVLLFAVGLGSAFVVASPGASATSTVDGILTGSVGTSTDGNAFAISLSASTVPAGTYEFDITDSATIHNFDLLDPGGVSIDKTSIAKTETDTWTATLTPGTYTYRCDAHPSILMGTLTVTGGTTSTSTPSTPTGTSTSTPGSTQSSTITGSTTTTGTANTGAPVAALKVRIASLHATRKLVTVSVAANQLTRAVAVLTHKGKRLARAAGDGKKLTLRLKPRRALAPGSYLVRVTVACCGSSSTTKKTIRIR